MLYCPQCNKKVDFNTVSQSQLTGAYKLDLEGPIDPVLVRSRTKLIHVCKNCGHQNLYNTKRSYDASVVAKKIQDEEDAAKGILLLVICAFLGVCGALFALSMDDISLLEALFCGGMVAIFALILGAALISD